MDNHHDHKATVLAVYTALDKIKNVTASIWFYEVWTPVMPNVLIDITDVAENKRIAINKHQSQVKCLDYSDKILGLNSYRAISMPNEKGIMFCEAYYRCTVDEFKYIICKSY